MTTPYRDCHTSCDEPTGRPMSPRARCGCGSGKRAKSCPCDRRPDLRRQRWNERMRREGRCLRHGNPKPCRQCRDAWREAARVRRGSQPWQPGGRGRPPEKEVDQ